MQFKFLHLDWEGWDANLKLVISMDEGLRNLYKKEFKILIKNILKIKEAARAKK